MTSYDEMMARLHEPTDPEFQAFKEAVKKSIERDYERDFGAKKNDEETE